ncbi:MAG: protein kinase, partial [Roseburia sp.]|nr:protein kinase [Roseburia sp.]
MKYNGVYEVDSAFVEGGTIKWVGTGNGEYIIATKGGKKYFLKRNMHIRLPKKDLPKAVYDKYKADAEALQKKQESLRAHMKGLTASGDRIVVENCNFWDGEMMFVTETDYIAGGLSDTFDYTVLPLEEFLKLAKRTAGTLQKLHEHGVIHGDLKPKNIHVTEKRGVYIPYLIDFDSSYPADEIPEWEGIGGSEGYQSPEVLLYGSDEGAADKSTVTTATDIFSLGVVFHKWWAGAFPSVDLEHGSVGAAVYLDKAVTIDKKFNVKIGENSGATLLSLMNWMFAKNPADRPTARQVADVLADRLEVPEEYHKGSDEKPFDKELWEAHRLVAELLPVTELKKLGVKSLKRVNEGGGSMSLKYRVATSGGAEKTLTISEICDAGYAKTKGADIEAAWDEHMIEFEPADIIAKKGYAKIKRAQLAFRKRYLITTASGREIDKGCEWLISEGLAHPKLAEIDADTPWPEHGSSYNTEAMG